MKNNYFIICIISISIILYYIYKNNLNTSNKNIKGGNEQASNKNKNWFKSDKSFTNLTEATHYCHSEKTNLLESRTQMKGEALNEDAWYKNDYGYSFEVGEKSGIKDNSKREGPAVCMKKLSQKDLELGDLVVIKKITQEFDSITHIPQFVNKEFNYNEFELSFNIERVNKMVVDLEGGILTLGPNNSNYHNLFIYIKKTELVVGLMGYNTHISINLHKIKTAVSMYFRLQYKNPYLNVYVNAMDNNDVSTTGYFDYLGNISKNMNTDFRLYLHPFLNSWCSLGTVNFIKMKEISVVGEQKIKKPNLSAAEGILNDAQTTITNLKISHKKRNLIELYNQENINSSQNYRLNYNVKDTIVFDCKLNETNTNQDGTLIKMFLENKNFLELYKSSNENTTDIMLDIQTDEIRKSLLKLEYPLNKKILSCYIEIVPYMNLNLLCIYLNNNFYRYVINLSDLKNKQKNIYTNFVDLSINSTIPLIETIKISTETFKYVRGQKLDRLYPVIEFKKNEALIRFQKNVKIEYVKIISNNNIIYTLYIRNHFENLWKNILQIDIRENNKYRFHNKNIIINDNRISNEYRLKFSTHQYYLIPRFILEKDNLGNYIIAKFGENKKNKILSYVDDESNPGQGKGKIELVEDLVDGTKWTMRYLMETDFEIKTKVQIKDGLVDYYFGQVKIPDVPNKLFVEGKPNTKSFYIAYNSTIDKNANGKPVKKYIFYHKNTSVDPVSYELQSTTNKSNCEFTLKQFIPESDVVAEDAVKNSEEAKKEKIKKLKNDLKNTITKLNQETRNIQGFNRQMDGINRNITSKKTRIKTLNENIETLDNEIFDLNTNIRNTPYINQNELNTKKANINKLLDYVKQDKFKDKPFFYSPKTNNDIKTTSDAKRFCEKYKTNLISQSNVDDSLNDVWGFYSEGVGIKTGKSPKDFFESTNGKPTDYYPKLRKADHACNAGPEDGYSDVTTVEQCAKKCKETPWCKFFSKGKNEKSVFCYLDKTSSASCPEGLVNIDEGAWDFYENVSFSTRAIAVCDKARALQNLGKIEREIIAKENLIKNKQKYTAQIVVKQNKIKKIEKQIETLEKDIRPLEQNKLDIDKKQYTSTNNEKKFKNQKKMLEISIENLTNSSVVTELIQFYGIEDPYPKLYIDDNNIKKSTQPCSYVHSDENIVFEHLPSKIITIKKEEDKFDETEKENFDKIENMEKNDKTKNNTQNKNLPDCTDAANKIVCDIIKGNMYENSDNKLVNKIYNFCSNNLDHYNNKLYSYQYDKDRYYYQDDNDYEKKERVKLAELTKQELEQVRHIKKLKDGIDLVSISTNKNLSNPRENASDTGCTKKYCLNNQINDIFKVFTNEPQVFKIKWSDDTAFKSSMLIKFIATRSNSEDKHIKNFKLIDDIFDDQSMKKYMTNMRVNLINKLKNNIKRLKADKPYLKFSEWGEHPESHECPMDLEPDTWDAPPPKKCCDEKDDCSVIELVTYKPPTCKKISSNSVNKRIENSKIRILKKLNKIILESRSSKLDQWNNLRTFLEDNFESNDIFNVPQFKYLYNSYNELIKTLKNADSLRKLAAATLAKMGRPPGASLLNSLASSFGGENQISKKIDGGTSKKRIKSYYKRYLKNPIHFVKNILEEVIQEEDEIIKNENQGFNNLTELYIHKKIPLFEYHGWDINNPEQKTYDKNLDGEKKEYWRLEWDGIYDPDKTEFQLFSLIEKKYLLNEEEEIIVNINGKTTKNTINKLSWSDKQTWGKGWKIRPTIIGSQDNNLEIEKLNEAYKNEMTKMVYNELYNKFEQDIQNEIKLSDDATNKAETEYKKAFKKQLDDIRKEDIISLNKNAWIFSPNIGKYGEFLISKPTSKFQKWMDFGGLDFKKYKFQIMRWGDDGPVYEKHFDEQNNEIAISRKNKSGGLEFLKNTLESTTNVLQWVGEDKWGPSVKWILEWDKKLEINLNSMKAPKPVKGEMDILTRYKLIENKKITITVGNKIKQISNEFNWENEFMAIKQAEQVGYYGCIDYAWIAEEEGKVVYYDDDYSTYSGEKNTLTRCWFVMDREKSITEKYLQVNKLQYELNFAKWYSYRKCFRNVHMGYGRYLCFDMRTVTWAYGAIHGMNSWRGNISSFPPSGAWTTRQETMLSEISSSSGECLTKINKPMTVYLKSPSNGYLRSDSFGKPEFSKDIKKPYITGWHLLMKYKTGKDPKWLKTHRGLIKSYNNYYTKIFENKTCIGKSKKLKIPKKLESSSGFTIDNCAEMFQKWRLSNGGEKYRWFMYLPKDNNFRYNECIALKIEDQCKGFQKTQTLPKYVTVPGAISSFRSKFGLGGGTHEEIENTKENTKEINGIENNIYGGVIGSVMRTVSGIVGMADRRIPVPQYVTYKLDDEYDSS